MAEIKRTSLTIMVVLSIVGFISYFAKYFFNIILSHSVDPIDYGNFKVGLRTFGLVSSLLLLGVGAASKRFLSRYLYANEHASAEEYMIWCLRLLLISSSIFIILLMALVVTMILLHVFNLQGISNYHIAIYLLFLTPFGAFSLLLISFLQANNNVVLNSFFSNSQFFIYIFILAFVGYAYQPVYDTKFLWALTFVVFALLNVIEFVTLIFCLPRELIKNIFNFKKHTFSNSTVWKKTSLKLISNQLIFLTLTTVDLYAVKFFNHTKNGLAQYAAILTISGLLWLITSNAYSFISPKVSSLIDEHGVLEGKFDFLQTGINRGNFINFLVITVTAALLIIFGNTLLDTFGSVYASQTAYIALVIMIVGNYLGSFCRPAVILLSYSGHENWLIYGSLMEFALIVVTATVFTIYFGIIGTACATSLTILAKTILYIVIVRYKFKIKSASIF